MLGFFTEKAKCFVLKGPDDFHTPVVYFVGFFVFSLVAHAIFLGSLVAVVPHLQENHRPPPITLKLQPKAPEPPKVEEEKPVPPMPPPQEKKINPAAEKKVPLPETKKIQGLTEASVDANSKSNVAAPYGNTLLKEDEGIRLSPDEMQKLAKDMSSDAILIQGSFVSPEYTPEALDANLEGKYVVDVYVDEQGKVLKAALRKKIGYAMDRRVLDVAKSARFVPRKDPQGLALAGWTEIRFFLEIP